MKPSQIIAKRHSEILVIASEYPVKNVRVSGSTVLGHDTENSDLDILVDALPDATLFDLGGLQQTLEERLGIKVDVRTPGICQSISWIECWRRRNPFNG